MELPAYHVPAWGNVFRATWERGWSFIKRAGSVILAATVVLWFLQGFGFENGAFGMVEDQDNSVLAAIATKIAWIFAPLGFGNWRATVASVSGLIAKENVLAPSVFCITSAASCLRTVMRSGQQLRRITPLCPLTPL